MKYFLILTLLLSSCNKVILKKDVISLGNEEECLWLQRRVTVNGKVDTDKLFYCCPNRSKKKFQPVCVENFFIYGGRTKDWDR